MTRWRRESSRRSRPRHRKKFSGVSLAIEHRTGTLELRDVSVAIAASHAHRAHALDATRYVIEQLKTRVPIWKREHYVDGTREWIDPSGALARGTVQ